MLTRSPFIQRFFIAVLLVWSFAERNLPRIHAEEPPKLPAGEKSTAASKFIRLERNDDDEPTAMQTAIVSFAKDDKNAATVDLIGAVHVGDKSYYEALNEAFKKYDAVLYEMVAPAGTRIEKGSKARNSHPVGALQNGLKGVLELEHQLEFVDYTKDNMIHADMSPDDFSKSMADRGESFWTMFFKLMGQGIAAESKLQAEGKSFDGNLMLALFDPHRATALKRLMAEQFENMEDLTAGFNGKDGSAIITDRNKVALQELTKQIAAGKKHIAIFYGAGHLPDMEQHLLTDFGLKRSGEHWLTAWNMSDEK